MKKELQFYLAIIAFLIYGHIALAQEVIYDFNSATPLAGVISASGTVESVSVSGLTDNNIANSTAILRPKTVGSPNQTGVVNLTSFPSDTDYSVTWKEYITTASTSFKKGFLLRANGAGGYTTGIKQGYFFMVQNNATTGSVNFRILNSSAATSLGNLKDSGAIIIAGFAVNKACWFRASVTGNVLKFEYSMDGVTFTVGTTYTDTSNLYTSGSTQLVYGIGSGTMGYLYDDIKFKSTTIGNSTITITGLSSYDYNGIPQGPNAATVTGSTGLITYSYSGTGGTSYGSSSKAPVMVGSYKVVATVAADSNYLTGVSSPFSFTINSNPSLPIVSMRRVISPTSPMYLIHVDAWADQPQEVIDLIPVDIRPFVVLNISMSTSILGDRGFDCAESWLNTCAQNGMWAMVQASSGIQNAFATDTNLSAYESLYIKYPNFIGYNFCEQSWGFDSSTFQQRLNLFTNLLEMGHKYGGYLYVNDCFSISNAGFNTISKFKASADFANATKVYKANMIYGNKFTNSYGYYDNESGALGAFLSGHAGNYAIRYDMYSWGWSGKGQIFGTEAPERNPDGNRSLFACPEAVMGVPIVEQMMVTGATVIDGPEVPWMSTFYKIYKLPAFDNMIADILRKIQDGTIRIPTANEVAARTKVVFVNDVDANTTNTLFSGLYAMDATDGTNGMLMNNRTWFKKSGRYATIPQLYSDGADEISLFSPGTVFVKKSQYQTLWSTEAQKVTQFNSLYPEVSTGDMYVSRLNNSLYAYNPWLNTNTPTSATIPLKYNTCTSVQLSYEPHTFSVINESANKLQIYLNNYRTDKNQLWTDYPDDFSWYRLQATILPQYATNPPDSTFRTSVIKVNGSSSQPVYTLTDRGSHKTSTASVSWANGVYTLTVVHNGPVDISIDCSGSATDRATVPAAVTVVSPVSPIAYTGEKQYEAEGAIVTSPASVNSTPLPIAYHGTGFVRFSSTSSSNSSVKFKVVNAEVAGSYALDIRYAALADVNQVDILVNGVKINTPIFPATGGEGIYAIYTQKINLNQGTNNVIELKANAIGAIINLDKIILTKKDFPFSFVSVDVNQKNSSQVNVAWGVTEERNVLKYDVLKSIDGTSFTSIFIANANNTGFSNYATIDNSIDKDNNYYKIKAVDNNGVEIYSDVIQLVMKNAIPFQAESGVLGSDWESKNVSDIIYTTSKTDILNSNFPGDASKVISFEVKFEKPGTYDLYAKVWVGSGGANDDSFYYGKGFGSMNPLADNNQWVTSNNLGGVGYSVQSDVVGITGTVGSGKWKWINVSKFNGGETPVSFTVVEGALTQIFQIGSRENGLQFDKFVFGSSGQSFTVKELESFEKNTTEILNNAPNAVPDQILVLEGATSSILVGEVSSVLANDTDVENNTLSAVLVSNVTNGTLTLNSNGTFVYVHNGSETTTDSFSYKSNDGIADSNVAIVSIVVTPVNDAPIAVEDSILLNQGEATTVLVGNVMSVLANDADPENDTLSAVLVSNVTNGTLTLNSDGTFIYVHNGSSTTSDSFTYKAIDRNIDSNVITVNIAVTPVNHAPVAVADEITVTEGGTVNGLSVLANDIDVESNILSAVLVSNVANGTLTLNSNGTFTYVHNGSETTMDSFSYKANDGKLDSNTVTVSITVTPVNDAPVGVADAVSVVNGGSATVLVDNATSVLTNDNDIENNVLTAVLVANVSNGILTLNSNGTFNYVHNGSNTTSDSFSYKANDGILDSNIVTVRITIAPFNLVSNNFTIESKSETCANKSNGQIIINALNSYNYIARINAKNYPFINNNLTVSNLAPGTHSVCITIEGKTFEQCFNVNIAQGGTITGKSTISSDKVVVEITEGTAPYQVYVNGKQKFETDASNFAVAVQQGDLLEVKTAKACEGVYSKSIVGMSGNVITFPNPAHESVELTIPTTKKEVIIELYSVAGKLISSGNFTIVNQKVQLNLGKAATGAYLAKIYLETPVTVKIIKY